MKCSIKKAAIIMLVSLIVLCAFPMAVFAVKGTAGEDFFPDDISGGSEELTNYSDTIQIMITEDQRAAIESQLEDHKEEIKMIAKVIYREARSKKIPKEQKAAVVWCILNRVDSNKFPNTIKGVVRQNDQFAWRPATPVKREFTALARDVFTRWLLEKENYGAVGRTLPKEYLYFAACNERNRFRAGFRTRKYWNWSLPNPYKLNRQK